ncbi:hypothetical protein EVAR_33009_1 [Eumeta japonica]|uniref:Uncharacterized protein n=1 Tax=Eumeta variegata TaxID=151549 RepID=A0A4C1VSD6_EUMVA|nr:hypothetical protein EVAR_33009_1 [Eumeta japonica]
MLRRALAEPGVPISGGGGVRRRHSSVARRRSATTKLRGSLKHLDALAPPGSVQTHALLHSFRVEGSGGSAACSLRVILFIRAQTRGVPVRRGRRAGRAARGQGAARAAGGALSLSPSSARSGGRRRPPAAASRAMHRGARHVPRRPPAAAPAARPPADGCVRRKHSPVPPDDCLACVSRLFALVQISEPKWITRVSVRYFTKPRRPPHARRGIDSSPLAAGNETYGRLSVSSVDPALGNSWNHQPARRLVEYGRSYLQRKDPHRTAAPGPRSRSSIRGSNDKLIRFRRNGVHHRPAASRMPTRPRPLRRRAHLNTSGRLNSHRIALLPARSRARHS